MSGWKVWSYRNKGCLLLSFKRWMFQYLWFVTQEICYKRQKANRNQQLWRRGCTYCDIPLVFSLHFFGLQDAAGDHGKESQAPEVSTFWSQYRAKPSCNYETPCKNSNSQTSRKLKQTLMPFGAKLTKVIPPDPPPQLKQTMVSHFFGGRLEAEADCPSDSDSSSSSSSASKSAAPDTTDQRETGMAEAERPTGNTDQPVPDGDKKVEEVVDNDAHSSSSSSTSSSSSSSSSSSARSSSEDWQEFRQSKN